MKWLIPICLLLTSSLTACEGYSCASGVILDSNTKLPLDSVFVKAITGKNQRYTDSSGKFEICNGMGGCMPECKDIVVEFSKPGYKTVYFTEPKDSIFYLEPL